MKLELKRALIAWSGLFALAFVNGALREFGIKRYIEEPWAHHLSVVTAIVLFSAFTWSVWSKIKIESRSQAAVVGALWFVLTILTETFVLNRWTSHLTWEQIFATYDLTKGELWPLVLIWVGLMPSLILRVRDRQQRITQG